MDITTLNRKRGCIKRALTTFETLLNQIDLETQHGNLPSKSLLTQLQDKYSRLKLSRTKFDDIQDLIEEMDDDVEKQTKERSDFDTSYYRAISKADEIINANYDETHSVVRVSDDLDQNIAVSNEPLIVLEGTPASPNSISNKNALPSSTMAPAVNLAPAVPVRLPTISLPKFSGELNDWLEFRDTFRSLIDTQSGLDEVQKLHYLRSSISGQAFGVIQNIAITKDNYSVAWEALCSRYDNKNRLINSHIQGLFSLQKFDRESSHKIRNLVDTVRKHLRGLQSLEVKIENWDPIIIYMTISYLDEITAREWDTFKVSKGETIDLLLSFLNDRASIIEDSELKRPHRAQFQNKRVKSFATFDKDSIHCPLCKESHMLVNCQNFLKLLIVERIATVKRLKICINCLKPGHFVKVCKSSGCRTCNSRHHTLLHIKKAEDANPTNKNEQESSTENSVTQTSVSYFSKRIHTQVLLSTALVALSGADKKTFVIRALLDSCSQSCFITKDCCNELNLKTEPIEIKISGINRVDNVVREQCQVKLQSRFGNYKTILSCLVVPSICDSLPNFEVDYESLNLPKNLKLADPQFDSPNSVELLIGASHYLRLLCQGQIDLGPNSPILQKTKLGWIVSGIMNNAFSDRLICNFNMSAMENYDMKAELEKFWSIEEISSKFTKHTRNECEDHFKGNTYRNKNGRFVVALPFKQPPESLVSNFDLAKRRFHNLERRFEKDSNFKELYQHFMFEYEKLGHMSFIANVDLNNSGYYLPHHGVYREQSSTTKLRVVFDASAKTDGNSSLNDIQMIGPVVQDDLFSILLRFRKHTFVVAADIEKMYRQVLIRPEDRNIQKILWRSDPNQPLSSYALNTVTYGTTAASFLAIRSLVELANEIEFTDPEVAGIIKHDFYVDDLLTGSNSKEKLRSICIRLTNVLKSGCFNLHKWISNESTILNINEGELVPNVVNLSYESKTKTLGLIWAYTRDVLLYDINIDLNAHFKISKRTILSTVSKIFDPLGLLSPIVIVAKILLQKIWQENVSWDESLSLSIVTEYLRFRNDLHNLKNLEVPRLVAVDEKTELHGFSDACERAYGACIYLRSINDKGKIVVRLLCAKSKVAPIKRLTIPRLELCGALTLARLYDKVARSLAQEITCCTFWCDSTIVLGWLNKHPNELPAFVGNRISEIIELTKKGTWRHVSSEDNPADLLSRGSTPSNIINCKLWWHGPRWLTIDECNWPKRECNIPDKLPELCEQKIIVNLTRANISIISFRNHSSLLRLKRVVGWVLRFLTNCRQKIENRTRLGYLSVPELDRAMDTLIKLAQREFLPKTFSETYKKYSSLSPFEHKGIVRVGGRLRHSELSFNRKFPILLDGKHPLSALLINQEHRQNLHPGSYLLLAIIRQKYWVTNGRNLVRKIIKNCIHCFRVAPSVGEAKMGDLPVDRVSQSFPFAISGTDYAGPIMIRDKKARGYKTLKSYICIFVCFSTKAIHLELVSDLSSASFILALRRFVSRRGKPARLYSDNGTNFVGANRELKELAKFLISNETMLSSTLADLGIEWKFIPPHSPHMGGLWEANIKSVKRHLKRVTLNSLLTFEELYSLLVQIEAIVNSRPICPLSSDPNDLSPLTPSHFLIGRPMTTVADPDILEIPVGRLSRFQFIQRLRQQFWKRWKLEYLSTLQQRAKWRHPQKGLVVGDLVLLKDDNRSTLEWKMGRIVKTFLGSDGSCRVVSVKTSDGEFKRAVNKLCPLPMDREDDKRTDIH